MEKVIKIDGKDVRFKANAATALVYRREFQKDLFDELSHIDPKKNSISGIQTVYELAYIMAKQGDKSMDLSFEDWLDNFDVFPIEKVGAEVLQLWQKSNTGLSVPKNR